MTRWGMAAAAVAMLCSAVPATVAPANGEPADRCTPWSVSEVASGFGLLENLGFDGRGRMLLSEQTLVGPGGAIRTLAPTGARGTLVPNVTGPGGIVVEGGTAYFVDGNVPISGAIGLPDGRLRAVDLDSGGIRTVATGLIMPNGLARLPSGDFVTSRDIGLNQGGLTRIRGDGSIERFAPGLGTPNGLVWDSARERLLASTFLTPQSTIAAVSDAGAWRTLVSFPGVGVLNSADDLTVGDGGQIFQALNVAGRIERVSSSGASTCTIAAGLPLVSSVRFGRGAGWDSRSLYATSFLGKVFRVSPGR